MATPTEASIRKRAATDDADFSKFSFFSYAKLSKLSPEAMAKLALYSVDNESHGAELCSLFRKLILYTRKMKEAEVQLKQYVAMSATIPRKRSHNQLSPQKIPPSVSRPTSSSSSSSSSSSASIEVVEVITIPDDSPANQPSTSNPVIRKGRTNLGRNNVNSTRLPTTPSLDDSREQPSWSSGLNPPAAAGKSAATAAARLPTSAAKLNAAAARLLSTAARSPIAVVIAPRKSSITEPAPSVDSSVRTEQSPLVVQDPPANEKAKVSNEAAEQFIRSCSFCSSSLHNELHCDVYTTCETRHERRREANLCLHCLLPYDRMFCDAPAHAQLCMICGLHRTHAAFCPHTGVPSMPDTRFPPLAY